MMPDRLKAKLKDPAWHRETVARIEGDTRPGSQIHGYGTGIVHGVRAGEAIRPLFGMEIFSSIRLIRQPDQSYQRLCRELVFYRDLASGALLDEWQNVYTGERVRVVDIANDPFNYVLNEHGMQAGEGGFNNASEGGERFAHQWYMLNENTLASDRDVHLYYKNALDPKVWVRESAGPMNQVSEFLRFFVRLEDLENPALTHLPYSGVWARATPWLPWMLMDGAPGHCLYVASISTRRNVSQFAPDVQKRVQERYPKYVNAPEKWGGESLSSLEHYVREQKPAPRRGS
jgi:hypothetical protein